MKFITPVLLIAASISACKASSIGVIDPNVYQTLPQNCKTSLENTTILDDCMDYTNIDKCDKMMSESCQNFYSNPASQFEGCVGTLEKAFPEKSMLSAKATVKFVCEKDEYGETCPLASQYANKDKIQHQNELEATCYSKICRENGIAMYSSSFGGISKLSKQGEGKSENSNSNGKDRIREFLESDKCKELEGKGKPQDHLDDSSATSNIVKLGSIFVVSLSVLLSLY